MTDRVYPSAKPNGTATHPTPAPAAAPIANPPLNKSHLYNPTRHPYRPTPTSRHRHKRDRRFSCRRCFCLSCFWSILILIAILLLAAIGAAVFYVLYHPHRPLFSVSSLKISAFNLTTMPADESTHLTTRINATLSTRNPNKKITYLYDPMTITVESNSINLSSGSFANHINSSPGETSTIHTAMAMNNKLLDAESVNSLKSDLKRKGGLPMEIVMETMVAVKMEKLKTKKIGIRIKCDGIHGRPGRVPKGKNVIPANIANPKCKLDLIIKIWNWKWTF